jgi:hypothetical protein
MAERRQLFTGRTFLTTIDHPPGPDWEPLEGFARLVWQRPELPQFHPVEFMHMTNLRRGRTGPSIRLYKHTDTRRYLNLDDGGHAYAYVFREEDDHVDHSGGRYRRYTNPIDAIGALGLWKFDSERLFRSYPTDVWHRFESMLPGRAR